MTITQTHYELFQTGTDFKKVLFLDNFYENLAVDLANESDLVALLKLALKSTNDYIRRTAFKILCQLSLSGKISNPFLVLSELHTLLQSNVPTLQAIALKYFPYFQGARTPALVEQIQELSDSSNGEVASQAYFCLGVLQLTESTSLSTLPEAIVALETAKPHFKAATLSIENRVDADFYLLVIDVLNSVLTDSTELAEEQFAKIKTAITARKLYEFDEHGLELDFLVFQLVDQLRINFSISSAAERWLEVKNEVSSLMQTYQELRKIKDLSTPSEFLRKRLFCNIFELIEGGIYQAHLASNRHRLKALQKTESETILGSYLQHLLSKLPVDQEITQSNPELLALFSEIEGSQKGLALYQSIPNKSVSTELLNKFGELTRKYKNQQQPYKTGYVLGEEVYYNLRKQIENFLPDYPETKLEAYFKIVEEVIRYTRTTFVDSDRKRFAFLYAQSPDFKKGKGQNALEQDLQDSMLRFFEHSAIKDGLDHEKARFVDGGRVDIVYKKDLITIPIELKKSKQRPTIKEIEDQYIAQVQNYTAGYDQLGIFVLLELSNKAVEPPPNFKDWFKVHHLEPSSNMDIEYPDYIISVVIQGNRTTPSSKSKYY